MLVPSHMIVRLRLCADIFLLLCVEQDMGEVEVDFPFRVSPAEQAIIQHDPRPPCSLVLVGRSGTGKTTCAIYRMWARWLAFQSSSTEEFNQVSCHTWLVHTCGPVACIMCCCQ